MVQEGQTRFPTAPPPPPVWRGREWDLSISA